MKQFRRFSQLLFLFTFGLLVFSGCSTDLDPNDDYKESMVIYSILNPTENVHYARISKAFLNTNADARDIARNIPDSTTYPDILNVRLQKLSIKGTDTTVVLPEYPMVRIDTVGKEPGTFFSGHQVLYRTEPGNPGKLDERTVYRIVSTNTRTGLTASGATAMVQENATSSRSFCVAQVSQSIPGTPCLDTVRGYEFNPQNPHQIIYRVPTNASIYNIKMVVYYTETDGGTTQRKRIEWYIRNNFIDRTSITAADPTIKPLVEKNFFYQNLLTLIGTSNQSPNLVRKLDIVYLVINAGSESLATNYVVNNSFSVFSQTKPEFDNISNGTGLVGSRIQKYVKLGLSIEAMKILREDSKYAALHFQ